MDKPVVGLAVVVKNDKGEMLFGKRLKSVGYGTFELPGGSLEKFETFEECAEREVFEETNIRIKNIRLVTVLNNIWKDKNAHCVTVVMTADYESGTLQTMEPSKNEGFAWYAKPPEPLFETGDFFQSEPFLTIVKGEVW